MSFTDQKQRVATEQECKASWGGIKNGFRCYLCGHKFKVGNKWRWSYCDKIVNFMVCNSCDTEDVKDKLIALHKEFYSDKFWWFRQNEQNKGECKNIF